MYFGVIYVAAVAIDVGYRTASRYPWSDAIQITRGLARPAGKPKGVRRSEVKSQPTSSLMHLCISGDRNDIGPSLLFIFRSPCSSSRPLPCSIEKSRSSLPTTRCDATSVHRPQCRARFLVSPPPLLKLTLLHIYSRTNTPVESFKYLSVDQFTLRISSFGHHDSTRSFARSIVAPIATRSIDG